MYTQCPQCKTRFRISAAALRRGRGEAHCDVCNMEFNALELLRADDEEATPAPHGEKSKVPLEAYRLDSPPPWEGPVAGRSVLSSVLWSFGSIFLVAALAFQVTLFEGERLAQDESARPWLEGLCQIVGCIPPPYRNRGAIDVLERSLLTTGEDCLEFRAILINQGDFPQPLPHLQLTLQSFSGQHFARRVFTPEEYLTDEANPDLLEVGSPLTARLLIAKPTAGIGGYLFELI